MKVQGLNAKDADEMDRAFRWILGEQLLRARNFAQDGNTQGCQNFIEAAEDTLATYKKISEQIGKYDETGKKKCK